MDWLAASVGEETFAVADLARLTHHKTLGNPFFVRQFLRDLVDDGVLRIDGSGMWSWDVAAVERRSVSENVGDLVSRQVERLPGGVRQVLQAASCVGPEFDLDAVVGIVWAAPATVVAGGLHRRPLRQASSCRAMTAYAYASEHEAGINPPVHVPPRPCAAGGPRVHAGRGAGRRPPQPGPSGMRKATVTGVGSTSWRSMSPATSSPG